MNTKACRAGGVRGAVRRVVRAGLRVVLARVVLVGLGVVGVVGVVGVCSPARAQTDPPAASEPPEGGLVRGARTWSFDDDRSLEGWGLEATGDAGKRMPAPKISEGKLYLLESWSNSTGVASVPGVMPASASVEIAFTFVMNTGCEGLGVALLDTNTHGGEAKAPALPAGSGPSSVMGGPGVNEKAVTLEAWGWEAPNFPRGLSVGLDASNPPNRDPFKGSGNMNDRPQHEASIHWDGWEIVKKTTALDWRDEKPHAALVRVQYVCGGAEVSLTIDDEVVFERVLVARAMPVPARVVLGAQNGATAGDVLIDDLRIAPGEAIDAATSPLLSPPLRVNALERVLNDQDHPANEGDVEFPSDTRAYGRILCTLRLDKPATRFDPWDRLASVSLITQSGEKFELVRYITPYHRGYEWHVDVTDFRPLLRGKAKIVQECVTYGEGYVVSVTFEFYSGAAEGGRQAIKVENLWSGMPEIGNPDVPVRAFFEPRRAEAPAGATSAKVRVVTTGHGMSPNTGNAAEFMAMERTLRVNGVEHTSTLWNTDNYLNPCRPQGGTWKYDRAGWAPGDVVRPWEVEVGSEAWRGGTGEREAGVLEIEHMLADYVNEARGKTDAPRHRVEAVVVWYDGPNSR